MFRPHRPLCFCATLIGASLVLGGCERPADSKAPRTTDTPQTQTGGATPEDDARPVVMATFFPTFDFTRRIAGDAAAVELPLPADADPIFFRPDRELLQRYQQADLIVVNGAEFEKWVQTASLPKARTVDTAAGFADRFVTYEGTTHSHGDAGEHTHEGVDGHTWLDPMNAADQAEAIYEALAELLPGRAEQMQQNAQTLQQDLEALHNRMLQLAPRLEAVTLLANHPAYNYLAERYGLDIINLDLNPDTPLSEDDLAAVETALQEAGPGFRVMLWEGEPVEDAAERLRQQLAVRSVYFSPAEMVDNPQQASFIDIMNSNIDRLQAAIPGG